MAGAYSLVTPRINAALAGVAIAVSLVPPLATTGICLALERYDLALGAFLLFFANFLAIQLASVFVFMVTGFIDYFHLKETEILINKSTNKLKLIAIFAKRFLPSIILLIIVAWNLSLTLINLVNEKQFKRQLENIIKTEVQQRTGARLAQMNYKKEKDGKINTIAVVMTPQEFLPIDVAKIQQHIQEHLGKDINIIIRSILSKDADINGTIFLMDEEKLKRKLQNEEASFLSTVTQLLNQALDRILGAHLVEVKREDNEGLKTIIAIVRTPVAINPNQVETTQSLLQTVDKNSRLIVRSVLTRDADASQYLYESTEQKITQAPNQDELELRKKLQKTLKKAIKQNTNGGILLDFQYTIHDNRIELLAVIQTPQNFSNEQVKLIQNQLKEAEPRVTRLVVRSVVGIDMDENGVVIPTEENHPVTLSTPDELNPPALSHKK